MLTRLDLENFMIIDKLSMNFQSGLNILSGESGVGKSVWIDAIDYALSARADAKIIRYNQTQCQITLHFRVLENSSAGRWIKKQGFHHQNTQCIIKRTITLNGRSRATLNNQPCSLQQLRDIKKKLLNIHNQQATQALLTSAAQQKQLDAFSHNLEERQIIEQLYQSWKTISIQLEQAKKQADNRGAELSLLHYQRQEIEALDLKEKEWEQLSDQHEQLHHLKDKIEQLNKVIQWLTTNETDSTLQRLQKAVDILNDLQIKHTSINTAQELLNNAIIYLQEANDELLHYRHTLDLSPDELNRIENRLRKIQSLARKHHAHPSTLLEIQQSLDKKIQHLEHLDSQIRHLEITLDNYQKQYEIQAEKLSSKRRKSAEIIEASINPIIQSLGIKGGSFRIKIEKQNTPIHPNGREKIQFEIRTNPGQLFHPLSKIISGGELSRINLALNVVLSQKQQTPIMIFDEIDTGTSGQTAETIGKLLQQLGQATQVLCITHLAQVAAQGHHHYKISKNYQEEQLLITIQKLSPEERIHELARMLGGARITERTRSHANELLKLATHALSSD